MEPDKVRILTWFKNYICIRDNNSPVVFNGNDSKKLRPAKS